MLIHGIINCNAIIKVQQKHLPTLGIGLDILTYQKILS